MSFSQKKIDAVWDKGTKVTGVDATKWRKDACGAWIFKTSYGKESQYGWQIDHIKHKSKGGSDELSNLRPLHWENNQARGEGQLKCVVTSSGNKNIKNT